MVVWGWYEEGELRNHYLDMSLDELEDLLKIPKSVIVRKIISLSPPSNYFVFNPGIDEQRMQKHERVVEEARAWKKGEWKNREREVNEKIHQLKIKLGEIPPDPPSAEERYRLLVRARGTEKEWTKSDIVLLANTYFTHNWLELAGIFRFKGEDVQKKLSELYMEEPEAWDGERIYGLEQEAERYLTRERKKLIKGYVPRKAIFLKRRPEIDELMEQGKNQVEIAECFGLTGQAISQYLISRRLQRRYHEIQGRKKRLSEAKECVSR